MLARRTALKPGSVLPVVRAALPVPFVSADILEAQTASDWTLEPGYADMAVMRSLCTSRFFRVRQAAIVASGRIRDNLGRMNWDALLNTSPPFVWPRLEAAHAAMNTLIAVMARRRTGTRAACVSLTPDSPFVVYMALSDPYAVTVCYRESLNRWQVGAWSQFSEISGIEEES